MLQKTGKPCDYHALELWDGERNVLLILRVRANRMVLCVVQSSSRTDRADLAAHSVVGLPKLGKIKNIPGVTSFRPHS